MRKEGTAQRLIQQAQRGWEMGQSFSNANVGLVCSRQIRNFSREDILKLPIITARWEHDVSVSPEIGANWRKIAVAEQSGHHTGNHHQHTGAFKHSEERHDMVGIRAFHC